MGVMEFFMVDMELQELITEMNLVFTVVQELPVIWKILMQLEILMGFTEIHLINILVILVNESCTELLHKCHPFEHTHLLLIQPIQVKVKTFII